MLILMAGLPGTGKSTVARQLADRLQATILSKDAVRHALFPPELVEYSAEQDDFVIDVLLNTAEFIWRKHAQQFVILDGRTFSRSSQRKHVMAFAEEHQQTWKILECMCDDTAAKSRLSHADPTHPAGNRTPDLYDQVKRRWEPITEEHFTIRTDQPVDIHTIARQLISR